MRLIETREGWFLVWDIATSLAMNEVFANPGIGVLLPIARHALPKRALSFAQECFPGKEICLVLGHTC